MTPRPRTTSCSGAFILIFLLHLSLSEGSKPCLASWVEFEGHCYKYIREPLTAMTALAFCNKQGGQLVDVKSAKESDFLTTISPQPKDDMWIGINNLLEKSNFVYTWSGEHIRYHKWASGQPQGGNTCVVMKDRTWHQHDCTRERPFVCKMQQNLLTVVES